ncbi:MAG: MATE family efflux transporter [bacterium]
MAFGKEKDLTQGSIKRYIFTLGIPVILGMTLQQLYSLIDLYWVGRLGPDAIASVSLGSTLFFVFFSIAQVLGQGAMAIIAYDYGQGNKTHAAHTTRNALFIAAMLGVVLSAVSVAYARPIMALLGGRGDVVDLGAQFLRPFGLAFFFQMISFVLWNALRGAGDMRSPMIIMFFTTVLNMILDPFLIYGLGPFPKLGVAGAGIATLISTFAGAGYLIFITITGRALLHVPFDIKYRPDWRNISEMLKIGIPAGIQLAFLSFSVMLIMKAVSAYGMGPVAALGTSWKLLQFATIPVMGLGAAVATLVGQNLGAGKPERAMRATSLGITAGIIIAALPAAVLAAFPDFFMGFFTKSKDVISVSHDILRVLSAHQLFVGTIMIYNSAFAGAGDNTPPMISAMLRAVIMVGLAYSLPPLTGYGLFSIWFCMPASSVAGTILLAYFYRLGHWKTRMQKRQNGLLIAASGE